MPKFQTKEEANAYYRDYRAKNKEQIRKYKREYMRSHRRGEKYTASIISWAKLNAEKIKAQKFLRMAVRYGYVIKKPCEICGAERSVAHHEDYNKPLDVNWLCEIHHREKHPKDML
jgi:hypothetical protein